MKIFLVVFALTAPFFVNCVIEKPSWYLTCDKNDPGFAKCHTESMKGMFNQILTGSYKIDGLGPFEPMHVDKIQILQGDGPVNIDARLSNVNIYGISKIEIVQNIADLKDYTWNTKMKIPKLRLEGDYRMKGQILVIPLNGHGKCWFEPVGLKVKLRTFSKLYTKNNYSYFNITGCQVKFTMDGLKFRMSNLFEGAKDLDDNVNGYLNENWKDTAEALKPILSKTIGDIMKNIMERVYHHFPVEYIVTGLTEPN